MSMPRKWERLELGLAFLRDRGLEVRWDPAGFDSWRYLAGDDGRRLYVSHRAFATGNSTIATWPLADQRGALPGF